MTTLEKELTKLGFNQNPDITRQRNNDELDVNVYVDNDKITSVQISKVWNLGFEDLTDCDDYLTKVTNLIEKVKEIL